MKRIAFIAHLSEVSGAGVALVETVAGLSADPQFQAFLILPGNGKLVERAKSRGLQPYIVPNPEVAISDAGVFRLLRTARLRVKYVIRLRRFFKQHDVNLAYINSSASIFPGIAARLAGVPVAWHIHETLDNNSFINRTKKRLIRRWADGLIYASESAKEHLPPRPGTSSLIAKNAIRIDELAELRQKRLSNPADEEAGRATLLLNGAIALKGADILLKAVRQLQGVEPGMDIHIVITGPPPREPAFASELKKLSLELPGQVTMAGLQESLVPMFKKATIYISASRTEAMPIAVVEAMAAGVPVIATDVGDCAELLDHGRCGWIIPPENPAALAAAIAEALANPALARKKAEAAFAQVSELYGRDDFWKPLKNFLNGLLPGS